MSLVEQVNAVRVRVAQRLAELQPLVREYEELLRVAADMGIEVPAPLASTPADPVATADPASTADPAFTADPAATATAPTLDAQPSRALPRAPEPQPTPGSQRSQPASEAKPKPAATKPRARRSTSRSAASARKQAAAVADEAEIAAQIAAAVAAEPGKSVVEYAAALGLAPAALYRPVRELTAAGELVKRSRQLYPPESS